MIPTPWKDLSLNELALGIRQRSIDPCDLTDYFLDKIENEAEKDKIFVTVFSDEARRQAEAARARIRHNDPLSLFDGIPLVWKDNFYVKGKPTSAGIPALARQVAGEDAAVYRIAANAGFVCLGKTNMTELAFSGIGINPSYGTPRNPFDQIIARVPGGSSSGSAVATAKGLCAAALGTDSGGSIRIPAAWNNLVGLKTTAGLIPTDGVVPLSPTLDTVGFITRTVADAEVLYKVFTQGNGAAERSNAEARRHEDYTPATFWGEELNDIDDQLRKPPPGITDLRLLVCTNQVWDDIHPQIREVLDAALERIAQSGATVAESVIVEFDETAELVSAKGNIVHYEGYQQWGAYLNAHPDVISPEILAIFNRGAGIKKEDIDEVHAGLRKLGERYHKKYRNSSAVLMPTVVHIPPVIAELEANRRLYNEENALALRNTRLANLFGLCALSLPIGFTANGFPVGLMLVGLPYSESGLLSVAATLEPLFR